MDSDISAGVSRATSYSSLHQRVLVHRPVYNQPKFDEGYETNFWADKTFRQKIRGVTNKLVCNKKTFIRFLLLRLPFINILRNYCKDWILGDILAGITVAIMHLPQGMAYAMLASLPPVYGLYVSFFPVILYFFFGTSRHISLGTFAVICLMVGSAIDKETKNFQPMINSTILLKNSTQFDDLLTKEKVTVALQVTLMTGIVQLGMGFLQLGFLTIYLSDPLVSGFTTGAAIHVLTSQVSTIFGIKVVKYSGILKIIYTYIDLFKNITTTNVASLVTSIIAILMLVVVKECINARFRDKMKMPVPMELILVVLATVISYFANFEVLFSMDVVGNIPTGIPMPAFPKSNFISHVWVDGIVIAIVSYAVSMSLAKIFADKHSYESDSNQELMAHGGINIIGSFLNCFVASASLSRSLVQDTMGGKTQVAGIVSSILILLVLLWLGPLFSALPNCVLAATIVVNLKGMFMQFNELKRLWTISKYDFAIWLVSFIATALLDVDVGLGVSLGFSLLTVIVRTQSPYVCILGRIPGTDIYRDITLYKAAEEVRHIKIYRFESSLYFANADDFRDKCYSKTKMNPRKMLQARTKVMSRVKRDIKEAEALKKKKVPTATLR